MTAAARTARTNIPGAPLVVDDACMKEAAHAARNEALKEDPAVAAARKKEKKARQKESRDKAKALNAALEAIPEASSTGVGSSEPATPTASTSEWSCLDVPSISKVDDSSYPDEMLKILKMIPENKAVPYDPDVKVPTKADAERVFVEQEGQWKYNCFDCGHNFMCGDLLVLSKTGSWCGQVWNICRNCSHYTRSEKEWKATCRKTRKEYIRNTVGKPVRASQTTWHTLAARFKELYPDDHKDREENSGSEIKGPVWVTLAMLGR